MGFWGDSAPWFVEQFKDQLVVIHILEVFGNLPPDFYNSFNLLVVIVGNGFLVFVHVLQKRLVVVHVDDGHKTFVINPAYYLFDTGQVCVGDGVGSYIRGFPIPAYRQADRVEPCCLDSLYLFKFDWAGAPARFAGGIEGVTHVDSPANLGIHGSAFGIIDGFPGFRLFRGRFHHRRRRFCFFGFGVVAEMAFAAFRRTGKEG